MPAPSPRARRGVGGVLVDTGPLRRHPGFRRLWAGQLIASLGSQLTVVAVAYQTYRLTGSTAMVGLVSLSGLVPLLAGSVLGGPAVDAWDRRKVMLATQVLLAVGAAGLAVNAMLAHPLLWPMFVCTAESAAFQSVDFIVAPTSPTVAFKLGERTADPLSMYLSDYCTVPMSLAGIPAISIPCGLSGGLPVGLQIAGPALSDSALLDAAHALEQAISFDASAARV